MRYTSPHVHENTLGFAIVGCGMIARFHARALAEVPGTRLAALVSRNPASAEKLIADTGSPAVPVFTDLADALQAAGRRRRHHDHAERRPPGAGRRRRQGRQARRRREAAGDHAGALRPDHRRLRPERRSSSAPSSRRGSATPTSTLKEAVDAGRFGRLTLGETTCKWWRSQAYYDEGGWKGTQALDGGGALMNQAIHNVDLLLWMMGDATPRQRASRRRWPTSGSRSRTRPSPACASRTGPSASSRRRRASTPACRRRSPSTATGARPSSSRTTCCAGTSRRRRPTTQRSRSGSPRRSGRPAGRATRRRSPTKGTPASSPTSCRPFDRDQAARRRPRGPQGGRDHLRDLRVGADRPGGQTVSPERRQDWSDWGVYLIVRPSSAWCRHCPCASPCSRPPDWLGWLPLRQAAPRGGPRQPPPRLPRACD